LTRASATRCTPWWHGLRGSAPIPFPSRGTYAGGQPRTPGGKLESRVATETRLQSDDPHGRNSLLALIGSQIAILSR
jgi:hypothetical protein